MTERKDNNLTFPVEAFPEPIRNAVVEVANAFGVTPDIPAITLLVGAGACIGNTMAIQLKEGYIEHPNLFGAVVGESSETKSPPMRAIMKPLVELENERKQDCEKLNKNPNYESQFDDFPEWNQLVVGDFTPPALVDVLVDNPRGVLIHADELTGLFKGVGRNSNYKHCFIKGFDSDLLKVNRVNKKRTCTIPKATLSLLGSIQPDILPTVFTPHDLANGLLPRFLFIVIKRSTPLLWSNETVSREKEAFIKNVLKDLLYIDTDAKGHPHKVMLTSGAKTIFQDWYNQIAIEDWQSIASKYSTKIKGQIPRFALILHCLEAVCKEHDYLEPVTKETMQNALLLGNYFKQHQRKVYDIILNKKLNRNVLSPPKRLIINSILALKSQVKNHMLATMDITNKVNETLDPASQLSPKSVGKLTSSLGLKPNHLPGKKNRGVAITDEVIDQLIELI